MFPLGLKLAVFFALVFFAVFWAINSLVFGTASRDLEQAALESNVTVNNRSADEAENLLYSVRSDAFVLLNFINIAGKDSPLARQAAAVFFEHKYYIASVIVPGMAELINNQFFIANEVSPGSVIPWLLGEEISIQKARQGTPVFTNPSMELGTSLIAMFYPWQRNGFEEAAIILFTPEILSNVFGTGRNSTFLANAEGYVLVHPDYRMVRDRVNLIDHPLLRELAAGDTKETSTVYSEGGKRYFGAAKKLSMGGLMLATSIDYAPIAGRSSQNDNGIFYFIIAVVLVSIILIWLLSRTITAPLHNLGDAMIRISHGDYTARPEYNFPDEIGTLVDKFTGMAASLEKREHFIADYYQTVYKDINVSNDKKANNR